MLQTQRVGVLRCKDRLGPSLGLHSTSRSLESSTSLLSGGVLRIRLDSIVSAFVTVCNTVHKAQVLGVRLVPIQLSTRRLSGHLPACQTRSTFEALQSFRYGNNTELAREDVHCRSDDRLVLSGIETAGGVDEPSTVSQELHRSGEDTELNTASRTDISFGRLQTRTEAKLTRAAAFRWRQSMSSRYQGSSSSYRLQSNYHTNFRLIRTICAVNFGHAHGTSAKILSNVRLFFLPSSDLSEGNPAFASRIAQVSPNDIRSIFGVFFTHRHRCR